MFKGDLDNQLAQGIGVRFEECIKRQDGSLDRSMKASMLTWMRNIDANIYVITTGNERKAAAFCLKWGVPYSKVIPVDSTLEIPDVVREMDMRSYWDQDKSILQNVNTRGHGKIRVEQWITPAD